MKDEDATNFKVANVIAGLRELSEDERMEVFGEFLRSLRLRQPALPVLERRVRS